jgi:S-(hydroxymethyl)glutathione dehydrogenase/alcohol dehydrogenase
VQEESVVPVWTEISSLELAMLVGTPGMGLGAALIQAPVEPGSNVAVFGCGPLGMGAVQAARLRGANRIIAIDPVKYRREAAIKYGATDALDPSTEQNLVERIRDLCDAGNDRAYAGGRTRARGSHLRGADFAIEAVGGELFSPRVEKSPDPTGILPMKQAYEATCSTGHVSYMGVAQIGEIAFRPEMLAVSGRTIHGLQMGGISAMRDYPRYVTLVEKGLFDVKSMATFVCKLDEFHQAFEHVAYRTSLASVITFN